MVSSLEQNPLHSFFSIGKKSIKQYALEREGRFSVDCESFRDHKGETMFKLFLHGWPDSPFYLTSDHVSSYRTERFQTNRSSTHQSSFEGNGRDPFYVLESHLLEILQGTGYGSISLKFEKMRKQKAAFICSVTFSYRHTITLEAK